MSFSKIAKIAVAACVAALMCAVLSGCGSSVASSSSVGSGGSAASAAVSSGSADTGHASQASADDPYAAGEHHATVTVEGYDPFVIKLDADKAPITVSNFCSLAGQGFYDGLTFYRFVDGFCMQGGSSNNSAAAANDGLTPIKGEFSSNGVDNPLADAFTKGTVAMARNSNPDSATSTFFVTLGPGSRVGSSLNGQYAAFGSIDADGMAIVDQIVQDYLPNVTDPSSGAIESESAQARIASIRIVD